MAVLAVALGTCPVLAAREQAFDTLAAVTGVEVGEALNLALAAAGISHRATVDPDRKFFKCEKALSVTPLRGDWTTARIECPSSWVRHIRTGLDRRVAAPEHNMTGENSDPDAPILRAVLSQSMRPGDVITASHLYTKAVAPRVALGGYSDAATLVGRRLKVALGENAVVQARHLHPDWMIVKDQIVDIEVHSGHISVVMQGKALENGQLGDMIEVENVNSGEINNFFVMTAKKVAPRAKMNEPGVVKVRVGD